MSFFDDDDEPRRPRAPRAAPRRPSGRPAARPRGRTAPSVDPQAIRRRQLVAAGVVVVLFIIIIVGVKACSDSARKRNLRDYNDAVSALVQKSDREVSAPLFRLLSGASGSTRSVELENQIAGLKLEADQELKQAQALDVPSEANDAQRYVLLAFELRRDALDVIANQLPPALSGTDNGAAARRIAGEMRAFDASDVIWSQRVIPAIRSALEDNGVPVGPNGEQVATSAFLPDLAWLDEHYVADQLGSATSSAPKGKPKPGTHGHAIVATTVGSSTLSTASTTTVPLTPAPVFKVQIANQGDNDETDVRVRLQVGTITTTKTLAKTTAGQTTTATISLPRNPPTGTPQTVKINVLPVPGEGTTDNNSQSYPVTFTR